MAQDTRTFHTELAVIGSGLAGMAAATFAMRRGISTAQAGNTGAIAYTTGYLDLLGDTGQQENEALTDPWAGLQQLRDSQPEHPLSRIDAADIRAAFSEFTDFLGECGIAYSAPGNANLVALTPAGTSKPTFSVPATMRAGSEALAGKSRCLVVDFKGLRGFSGRQVVANLKHIWPALSTTRLTFPGLEAGEIYPEVMARALEVPATREQLAAAITAVRDDAEVIGFPAILGMYQPDHVMAEMARLLGCPVFEIPTMPPSVPGIRLREMFEQVYPKKGLTLIPQQKVTRVEFQKDAILFRLADNYGPINIFAKTAILATGRFLSGGLEAKRQGIVEPLLDLPVQQPAGREGWFEAQYMGSAGHPIHQSGITVDESFRPIGRDGAVVDQRLFAAGVILANQDWIRGRCGAGVAIATAYLAVRGVERLLASSRS